MHKERIRRLPDGTWIPDEEDLAAERALRNHLAAEQRARERPPPPEETGLPDCESESTHDDNDEAPPLDSEESRRKQVMVPSQRQPQPRKHPDPRFDGLPHSEEMERELLSSMWRSRKVRLQCARLYTAVMFYLPDHALLFTDLSEIDSEADELSFAFVVEHLNRTDRLREFGPTRGDQEQALDKIFSTVPCANNWEFALGWVLDDYQRRQTYIFTAGLEQKSLDRRIHPRELLTDLEQFRTRFLDELMPAHPLIGASIMDYAEREIDMSLSLLGNRWLSRCQGAFVVSPSGHGKSSFSIQAAICWSCGLPAFAINPNYPLRILIIQSEDDDNDVIEMAQMINRLSLNEHQRDLVRQNTHIELVNDCVGEGFCKRLDDILRQRPADLVVINPYTAYQGGELVDDERNNRFLRLQLQPLLVEHNCGLLAIHHTPKTNYQNLDRYAWFDWMYALAGGAALTNWARGIVVIAPTKTPGTYRFIAAKRYQKIQWQEREYWFSHSVENNTILWVPSSQEQILTTGKNTKPGAEVVLAQVPVLEPILQEKLYDIMNKPPFELGIDSIKRHVRFLLGEDKIFKHRIPRPGLRSAVGYAQSPPPEDSE
jgi:hypothetical protein